MDITKCFLDFRETVRHLWNVYFCVGALRDQDWDLRDSFSVAYVALFDAVEMHCLPIGALPIAHLWDAETTVLDCYQVSSGSSELPLMIALDYLATGYWDHPTSNPTRRGSTGPQARGFLQSHRLPWVVSTARQKLGGFACGAATYTTSAGGSST